MMSNAVYCDLFFDVFLLSDSHLFSGVVLIIILSVLFIILPVSQLRLKRIMEYLRIF